MIKVFLSIIVFVGAVYFMMSWLSDIDDTNNVSTPQTSQGIDGSMAYSIAQNYLEMVALNSSPSSTLTTAFPMSNYDAQNMGNGRWNIVSFVDIRNDFGTESRHLWGATLTYRGGLWANYTNWELEKLIFDDKVVYP